MFFGSHFVEVAVHRVMAPKEKCGVAEELGRGTARLWGGAQVAEMAGKRDEHSRPCPR